ncbi:MAG: ubiquitin-like domain-containing protein [Anaerolineaceae bacterium]|nr:ubiquitin-like domain-containing protein [Anaerolineaceae bacterium]
MDKKLIYGIGAGILLVISIIVFLSVQPNTITLIINEERYTVQSNSRQVAQVLLENDIPLLPQDTINPAINDRLPHGKDIIIERAVWVQFWQNSELIAEILSANRRPSNLLSEADVGLPANAILQLNGIEIALNQELPRRDQYVFQVIAPVTFQIEIDGEKVEIQSTSATLGDALWEAGIAVSSIDTVSMELNDPLEEDALITIKRATPVTVTIGEQTIEGFSAAGSVGEALADLDLSVQNLDLVTPAVEQLIPQNRQIQLVRVQEETILEQNTTPYGRLFEPDPELALDGRSLMQAGQTGIDVTLTLVRYENDVEVNRTVEESWIASEPQDEILGYGQLIEINTVESEYGNLDYYRSVTMYATSYHPSAFSDGPEGHTTTRGGCTLEKGVVAVAAAWYPSMVGQEVYIPGYGRGVVCDSGGGIPDRYWIDLGYSDEDYVGWYHWVTVYFLTPVPATILWVLP